MNTMNTTQFAQRPTAATFHDPVLKVLGRLSKMTPNVIFEMNSVISEVCRETGIAEDTWGTQESSGKLWVPQWISVAYFDLKKSGHAVDGLRGKYGLTTAGVNRARDLLNGTATPDAGPETAEAPQVKIMPTGTGPSLAVGPGNDESAYHADPYIRMLSTAMTPCFGSFSTQSPVCEGCGLRGACTNYMAQRFSALSGQWREALSKGAGDVAATPEPVTTAKKVWDNTGAERILAAMECECFRCKLPVKKDAECWWIRGVDSAGTGIFHLDCQ